MSDLTIFGLANCDSCRKARRELTAAGRAHVFRDLRADPLNQEEILELWQGVGEGLLNRSSTTWRGLSEAEKAGDPISLLVAHPALIKRPVISDGEKTTLGWTPAAQNHWLG